MVKLTVQQLTTFMKQRCFVLYSLLSTFVQRRTDDLLKMEIPEKQEYVLLLRMSHIQKKLLTAMQIELGNTPNVLKMFNLSTKFWNHPDVLFNVLKDKEEKSGFEEEGEISYDWAVPFMEKYVPHLIENSPKMQILLYILDESIKMQDKILVFSQSLTTLNLIEKFMQNNCILKWEKDSNFYRLDGSTPPLERESKINDFNCNPKVNLFLVSTKAGCLGINLIAANRVVIVDVSWNPCNDAQAVSRVYRYHQKKCCYVYRFVMDSCLEMNIYNRQINKQELSKRVVDDQNPVSNSCFIKKVPDAADLSNSEEKFSDIILQRIIQKFSESLSRQPLKHDNLLVSDEKDDLSMEDKRLALSAYELEKDAKYRK